MINEINIMYRHLYKFIAVLVFFVQLTAGLLYAQPNTGLAQLEQKLGAAKTDKDKAEAGLAIAQYYLDRNDANCLQYAQSAIKPASKARMETIQARLHNVTGTYYFENGQYKKALPSLESEYAIWKKLQMAKPRAITCYNLGYCYYKLKNVKKADKYLHESWDLARKLGDKVLLDRLTRQLCDVALANKNYKLAYEYLNSYLLADNKKLQAENNKLLRTTEEQEQTIHQQDSTINEERLQKELLETTARNLELEKQIQDELIERQKVHIDNERLEKEKAELRNRIFLILIVSGVLVLLVVIYLYRNKRRTARDLASKNDLISNQKAEIEKQNEAISNNLAVIEAKNKDITDSISYAAKIQAALLSTLEQCSASVKDYFVFYQPKDIVSGDFYWAHCRGGKFVFTVGDCTGHSVPGAFMSMLGISLLNQIVVQQGIYKASEVLERMRKLVKSYLGQNDMGSETKDGMDMALCIWDQNTNNVNFSGAYNPLVVISGGEAKVCNAVKAPVGVHMREPDFTDEYFTVARGDRMYMFSDGFPDQFNARNHEKYKVARFRQLLLKTSEFSMQEQCRLLQKAYYEWKGDFIQIDDVCVLGIEV